MKKIKVAFDAGHSASTFERTGGKGIKYDDGKVFEEHDFNATVVKYTKELCESAGIDIVLTQPLFSEQEVSLRQRCITAKENKVDIIMSFHADYSSNHNTNGHWCFYWYQDEEGKKLAKIWDKHADEILGTYDRNYLESKPKTWTEFYMVRRPYEYKIPVLLMEHDFFSSDTGRKRLMDDEFRHKCAEVAARTVCEYFGIQFIPLEGDEEEMKFENAWMWTMLEKSVQGFFDKGIITDKNWVDKVKNKTLTQSELMFLLTVLYARDKGVKV